MTPSPGPEERRRQPRFDVGDLPGSLAFAADVDVLNLSIAGMAVATRTPLAPEKRLAITLGRPPDVVSLHATVCWCRPVHGSARGEDALYHAGLRFADVLTERARQLVDFMERNIVVALEQQLFGRLNLDGEETAHLEGDWRFAVRRISSTGMLIATSLAARPGERFDLEMALDGRGVAARGRVVNVAGDADQADRYLLGVAFEEMDPSSAAALRDFVRQRLRGQPLPEPS